jgi:septum formation protein
LSHHPFIYLASRSPRRRQLLEQIGVRYQTLDVDIDESRRKGEAPYDYVCRLAQEKAGRGWAILDAAVRAPVLGADTVVVVDDEILGKPADVAAAETMLARLSGHTHEVLTAVTLANEKQRTRLSRSLVTLRSSTPSERAAYCTTGEPLDKAGAYAIQGLGAVFVEKLDGSFSGVMGLPLFETAELLSGVGIHVFDTR